MNLKGRSLLTLKDFTKEEIMYLLELAAQLKDEKKKNRYRKSLQNKNIALIFEKSSTRTRCSFSVAANDEGACAEYLGVNDIHFGYKESTEDTARVLGRMFDGIAFRGYSQKTVETLAKFSQIPVWNGLTDDDHPTQVLADFMTILEVFGRLSVRFLFIGDGRNNVANALMIGAAKVGMDFTICSPKSLFPNQELVDACLEDAKRSNAKISITDDTDLSGFDVIYTDVWVSMGEEEKSQERLSLLRPYQVNEAFMSKNPEAIFMHCLPAVKGNEVTEGVFESEKSVVFDQAENRMHSIKAVMVSTL